MTIKKAHILIAKRWNGERQIVGVFSSAKNANDAREFVMNADTYYKEHPEKLYVDAYVINGEKVEK